MTLVRELRVRSEHVEDAMTKVMAHGQGHPRTILIDDPVQYFDDMNTAAFIDVLIGLSQSGKQLIVTICSRRFYELFIAKCSALQPKVKIRGIDLTPGTPDA